MATVNLNGTTLTVSANVLSSDTSQFLTNDENTTIEEIVLEDSVITIGENTFKNFKNLKIITNGNYVESIGKYAFRDCTLLGNISFPLVTDIHWGGFYNCTSLENISFPLTTKIEIDSFKYCNSLINISFPLVANIGGWSFADCTSLENISFPSATEIGKRTFRNCNSLIHILFPLVTNVGDEAFKDCINLELVDLPSATNIGVDTFVNTKITNGNSGLIRGKNDDLLYSVKDVKVNIQGIINIITTFLD